MQEHGKYLEWTLLVGDGKIYPLHHAAPSSTVLPHWVCLSLKMGRGGNGFCPPHPEFVSYTYLVPYSQNTPLSILSLVSLLFILINIGATSSGMLKGMPHPTPTNPVFITHRFSLPQKGDGAGAPNIWPRPFLSHCHP